MSSAEAEYVSLSACCAQVLWIRTQLTYYGFHFDKIHMYCDSKAAIAISCNPVRHSRYSPQSRAYRVCNKRTSVIVKTINVNFDEWPQMASDHVNSDPVPQSGTVTTSNELDLLFILMFDELLNGSTQVVSKSSAVTTADTPNQCQQQNTTPLNSQTAPEPTCQVPTQAPTVTPTENFNQAEMITENAQVEDDKFINIFCTLVQDRGETSSRHNKSLEIFLNQLEQDVSWNQMARCEELHKFDRLDVWELVDRPLCKNVINMKWLWKNKRDEENTVIRNKSRLVAKGYAQKEGAYFEESFAPVARSLRMMHTNHLVHTRWTLNQHFYTIL
nr:Gag-Pol polyprotein [Tanacetum cinerariifolium]